MEGPRRFHGKKNLKRGENKTKQKKTGEGSIRRLIIFRGEGSDKIKRSFTLKTAQVCVLRSGVCAAFRCECAMCSGGLVVTRSETCLTEIGNQTTDKIKVVVIKVATDP